MLHETPGLRLAGVGRPREIMHFLLNTIVWFEGYANLSRGPHNPETQRVQRQEVRLQRAVVGPIQTARPPVNTQGIDEQCKHHEKEGYIGCTRKTARTIASYPIIERTEGLEGGGVLTSTSTGQRRTRFICVLYWGPN